MKITIVSELSSKLIYSDGETFQGSFDPIHKKISFESDKLYVDSKFRDIKILDDGNILIKFSFNGEEGSLEKELLLEKGKSLIIEDKKGKWDKDLWETVYRDFKIELNYKTKEVDFDENNIKLQIHEKGYTSCGEGFKNGDVEETVNAKIGTVYEAKLMIDNRYTLNVTKINGSKISIESIYYYCDNHGKFNELKDSFEINETFLYYETRSGGYATRYDHESWYWSIEVELVIDGSTKFSIKKGY